MSGDCPVEVLVCTFRRPDSLAATLASLAAQEGVPAPLHVIVADNDDDDRAREAIEAAGRREGLALRYVHAPARNISVARNATLAVAKAPLVALIDDDATADPAWLASLLKAARQSGADVVLGPVHARYDKDVPRWMREGDFHSTAPVRRGGTISTGYTCNSLLHLDAPALKGRRFRHDLGKTGGEDTDFFAAAVRSGARIAFAPDALVTEPVEPERACLSWLVRRRFRSGQSHGLLLAGEAEGRGSRLAALLLAAGKCGVSVAGAAVFALSARRCAFWILRASLHAGVVSRLAGARLVTIYGGDDAARRS